MFRKNLFFASLLGLALLMTACGTKKEAKDDGEGTSIRIDVDDTEESDELTEETEPDEISEEDANHLLEEKLDGLGCSAIFDSETDIDENDYYTYTIIDSDDNELEQMLAVDAVSGEVYVYDMDEDKISDFKNFSLYNPEKDVEISWEGDFKLDDMTVSLEPADTNSFEFVFKDADGNNVFAGVAEISGNSAGYEDDDVSLTFSFEVDGSLKIANNGNINAYAGIYQPIEE